MIYSTLCYLERGDSYLMLHRVKKEHDANRDKWIGVGGKFEEGESPEECILRETREETGLTLTSYRYRGLVTFVSDNGLRNICICLPRMAGRVRRIPVMRENWPGFGNRICSPCRCGRATKFFCAFWRRMHRFFP